MELSNKLIKSLKDNKDFNEYMDYVRVEIVDLTDTMNIEGLDDKLSNEDIGQIVRSRTIAAKLLTQIIAPFLEFEEPKAISEDDIKKKRDKYGLS